MVWVSLRQWEWGWCRHSQWERPTGTPGAAGWPPAGSATVWEAVPLTPALIPLSPLQALGCQTTHSNQEVLQSCLLVFFATKPYVLPAVLAEVASVVTTEHILVSVAAGVSLSTLEEVSGLWGCVGAEALSPESVLLARLCFPPLAIPHWCP